MKKEVRMMKKRRKGRGKYRWKRKRRLKRGIMKVRKEGEGKNDGRWISNRGRGERKEG